MPKRTCDWCGMKDDFLCCDKCMRTHDLFRRGVAEGVKTERAAVVAHMRKVTLPFREREENILHDMADAIESGLFHVAPREAEEGKGT